MSHGFEFFSVALLFWLIVTIYIKVKIKEPLGWYLFLFGVVFSINLFIRYENSNLFLLAPITFLMIYLFIENNWEKFDIYTPTFSHPNLTSAELKLLLEKAFSSYYLRFRWVSTHFKSLLNLI